MSGESDGSDEDRRRSEHPPLQGVFDTYVETIDALRELHAAVAPHAEELDTSRLDPDEIAAVEGLTAEQKSKLAAWLRRRRDARVFDSPEPPDKPLPTPTEATGGDGDDKTDREAEDHAALSEVFGDDRRPLVLFSLRLVRMAMSPGRKSILNSSLLTSAVGAFEVLAGGVMAQSFLRFPERLGDTPEFSLRDLERFESIDEARDEAVDARVDDLLRKDLVAWASWFEEASKLKLERLAGSYSAVQEIMLRRNVIVHNAGRASRRYISSVPEDVPKPAVGEHLPVTDEYLDQALDELEILGTLWAISAWAKWGSTKEYTFAFHQVHERTYVALERSRWRVARALAEASLKAKLDASLMCTFQVNTWLATKRLEGIDAIREPVTKWDVSALDARFQIAKAALLDDHEAAATHARRAISSEVVDFTSMKAWPLLQEFRETPLYAELEQEFSRE